MMMYEIRVILNICHLLMADKRIQQSSRLSSVDENTIVSSRLVMLQFSWQLAQTSMLITTLPLHKSKGHAQK